ncbi:ADP-ribosylation [Fomitopsis betulina]|nr:ADP-ribosylation [Fomitopsis betulina]KAI0716058.1 ADP-ribosylation [Fomitopsis betulina]
MVPHSQASFRDVSKQFRDQWKHPTSVPRVVQIWKIYCNRDHTDEFSRYKLAIERKRNVPGGNSKRRWHGTVRACTVGDSQGQSALCNDVLCALCNIIRSSFHVAKAGQRTNFGRFGAGIYTSATSSKANDYVVEPGGSGYKAMLLNDVVLGCVVKMTTGDENLIQPPAGYDSVVGQPGGDLNYDEAIVYKNEAIRPLFLVIYRP